MKHLRARLTFALALTAVMACRCASAPAGSPPPAAEPITPADLVASIADVAAGKNAALAETGLVLKRIEFRLAVGTKTHGGGRIEILVLEGEASRGVESAFLQELTLEIPETAGRTVTARALVPGVREFVEAAMNTARDLARAAAAAGLPQTLKSMELTAKITRSRTLSGGISATIPVWVKPEIGGELGRSSESDNTVKMVFGAP